MTATSRAIAAIFSGLSSAGKTTKRGNLKAGMACEVTYRGPGTEAILVDCKQGLS